MQTMRAIYDGVRFLSKYPKPIKLKYGDLQWIYQSPQNTKMT